MRTESLRSKHVREERDQTMHKTCQSGTVKSKTKSGKKLKDVCERERNVKVGSLETALKAQVLSMALSCEPDSVRYQHEC